MGLGLQLCGTVSSRTPPGDLRERDNEMDRDSRSLPPTPGVDALLLLPTRGHRNEPIDGDGALDEAVAAAVVLDCVAGCDAQEEEDDEDEASGTPKLESSSTSSARS